MLTIHRCTRSLKFLLQSPWPVFNSVLQPYIHGSVRMQLLNTDKSEVIYFGTRQRLRVSKLPESIIIAGSTITTTDELKILGMVSVLCHLTNMYGVPLVRNCNFHLRALRHIRSSLTQDVANMMASSIIGSRIDYSNSLLIGISEQNLDRLQGVQSKAARIVCSSGRQVTSSDLLPVHRQIEFKTATL